MKNQVNIDHYILALSQKDAYLLRLRNETVEEVRDGVFPMTLTDDYEYAKSSRGNSFGYALKNFEKDKSVVKKERFVHFLRTANENLKHYLIDNCTLLLAGTNEDRNSFKRVSNYNHLISGEISGSYNSRNLGQLKRSAATILTKPG